MKTESKTQSPSEGFEDLLANNRTWVERQLAEDPDFFKKLQTGQAPPFLFFGCSDSRKSLNAMIGTRPGQLFIHRNIANQVPLDDPNSQAVLEFGILNLGVKHVVVGGHSHCGGVKAALEGYTKGAVGSWLRPLKELAARHQEELLGIPDPAYRATRLSELNIVAQAENVALSPAYQEARAGGKAPEIHGWFFNLGTGLVREIELPRNEWRERGILG